ncbi:MAG: Flp pilus assembly protein CpaB [Acidobacteria bacterium]|nr:Flp pilus assembly protein CpaB [Acidobacteriota bacterium]
MDKKKAMIFAIILAVVGVILIQLMVSGEKKKYTDASMLANVLIAKKNIPAGTPIDQGMLAAKKLYKEYLPKGAIKVSALTQIIGNSAKVDIKRGDPILMSYFKAGVAGGLTSSFLSSAILPGERAITVRVDQESSVAGLIRPGDYVDILGTFLKPGTVPIQTTLTILQAVPVLAIGSQVGIGTNRQERMQKNYGSITLSVTPEEAELIEFARRKTKLIFVLRNAEDQKSEEKIPQVDFGSIFGKASLAAMQKRRDAMNRKRHGKIEILK